MHVTDEITELKEKILSLEEVIFNLAGDISVIAGQIFVHRRDTHGESPFDD